MDTALWVAAGFLALAFAGAGVLKLSKPVGELAAGGMGFVEDVSPGTVRAIGGLEVAAAVGLVVPRLLGVATFLAPLAAVGLVLLMVGAIVVHVRRGEVVPNTLINLALLLIAGFVAWGRFGPHAF